ncbi:MAG: hypothetical protein DCC67_05575 [Planctomycetota bacterium]|nr:MAG: hypothetical protein DCC67_05575 [Planctomycetota bacterium]
MTVRFTVAALRPLVRHTGFGLAVLAACGWGCSSGPSRIKPPSIDADGAAAEAMEMYDQDADGALAGAELDASPGLKSAQASFDANQDGKIQQDEIQRRIEAWQATGIGVMSVSFLFTMDGQPLPGAQVTFEPEPFLGDEIKTAVGETLMYGSVSPSIPKEERPSADMPAGFQVGLYRVRVSKKVDGKETIPARYNAETTLGQQVSPDDPAIANQKARFDLTCK